MKKTVGGILKTRKRGGASMFVVLFTIIIISVIVLSFTRLIVSESMKTTNNDLSQSAYDSALAGVEDAKLALLKYHDCLDQGATASSGSATCKNIVSKMQDGINKNDCSTVKNVLGRTTDSENGVVIQETKNSTDTGNNANMLQSYTCVTIKEDLEDYRTTLGSTTGTASAAGRLRIIPIRADKVDSISKVTIKWFSRVNRSNASTHYCASGNNLYPRGGCGGGSQAPTTLAVRLIQTDASFDLSELSASYAIDRTDTGQVMLIPTTSGGTNSISAANWGESANKGQNLPINIRCNNSGDWSCTVDVTLPNTFRNTNRNDANTYLLVSLPYGEPETDISVMTYGNVGGTSQQIEFSGVQARIDSTGRANDLYRRVETRVELVDTYFAYPEYEITMTGGASSKLNKSFYATFNCWKAENGVMDSFGCLDSAEDLNMN